MHPQMLHFIHERSKIEMVKGNICLSLLSIILLKPGSDAVRVTKISHLMLAVQSAIMCGSLGF